MENSKKVQLNLCIPNITGTITSDGGTDDPGGSRESYHGGISGTEIICRYLDNLY